jgi:hypothetical protein
MPRKNRDISERGLSVSEITVSDSVHMYVPLSAVYVCPHITASDSSHRPSHLPPLTTANSI